MEDVSSQRPRWLEEATEIHLSDTGKREGETAPTNPPSKSLGGRTLSSQSSATLVYAASLQGLVCEEAPWRRSRCREPSAA